MSNLIVGILKDKKVIFNGNNKKIILYKNSFVSGQIPDTLFLKINNKSISLYVSGNGTNVGNVFTGNEIGASKVVPDASIVNFTLISKDNNLTLNLNGTIDLVNPNLVGTYLLTYSMCEKNTPSNCGVGVITIIVSYPGGL